MLSPFCRRSKFSVQVFLLYWRRSQVRYDLRGQGRSGVPTSAAGHASKLYADDFAAVSKAFGVTKPYSVGWCVHLHSFEIYYILINGFSSGVTAVRKFIFISPLYASINPSFQAPSFPTLPPTIRRTISLAPSASLVHPSSAMVWPASSTQRRSLSFP